MGLTNPELLNVHSGTGLVPNRFEVVGDLRRDRGLAQPLAQQVFHLHGGRLGPSADPPNDLKRCQRFEFGPDNKFFG